MRWQTGQISIADNCMSLTVRYIDSLYSSVYCDDSNQTPLAKLSHAGWQNNTVKRPCGLQSIGASFCNECTDCIHALIGVKDATLMKAMSLSYRKLKNSVDVGGGGHSSTGNYETQYSISQRILPQSSSQDGVITPLNQPLMSTTLMKEHLSVNMI